MEYFDNSNGTDKPLSLEALKDAMATLMQEPAQPHIHLFNSMALKGDDEYIVCASCGSVFRREYVVRMMEIEAQEGE